METYLILIASELSLFEGINMDIGQVVAGTLVVGMIAFIAWWHLGGGKTKHENKNIN